MKKLLLFALMLPLAFTSCSSDDEDVNTNEQTIIGVWQETFYWDHTDWHTWGLVTPPVWEFKTDKTYNYYTSLSKYQDNQPESSGTWNISDKYITTGDHARKYSFSEDKQTLTWENVAILKRFK
jgi:hypothetical protein